MWRFTINLGTNLDTRLGQMQTYVLFYYIEWYSWGKQIGQQIQNNIDERVSNNQLAAAKVKTTANFLNLCLKSLWKLVGFQGLCCWRFHLSTQTISALTCHHVWHGKHSVSDNSIAPFNIATITAIGAIPHMAIWNWVMSKLVFK